MEGTNTRAGDNAPHSPPGPPSSPTGANARPPRWPRTLRMATDELLFEPRVALALLGAPQAEPELLGALALAARVYPVRPGDLILRRDQPAQALVFLREGEAVLGRLAEPSSTARAHVVRPVRGPAWLDQGSMWIARNHALDAWATSPGLVLQWLREDLQPLLDRQQSLPTRLLANLATELRGLVDQAHGLMHLDATARFAQWLVERCPPAADERDTATQGVALRLTHRKRDIAGALAITPETLSRVIRHLSTRGLLTVQGYSVQVHDLPTLRRLASGAQTLDEASGHEGPPS